jgi:hypothetical protein
MYEQTSNWTTTEPRPKCGDHPDRLRIGREDEGPLSKKTAQNNYRHSRLWQNHLNYPGSSALAITIRATSTQTHFKRNNSWSVG